MRIDELEEWLNKCRLQDRKAQKVVYETFYGYVFNIVRRYCSTFEESRECCNDIFFKVFTKIDTFKADSHFKPWITQIAIRTAIDRYRTHQTHREIFTTNEPPDNPTRTDLQILDKLELEEKIKMVQQLSPGYRTVFNLYVFEQFTHEEIADELKISVGTSKSNLSKARHQLLSLLHQFSNIE